MADNTERNRSHWDENAPTYNTRFEKTIDQLVKEIQLRKDWIGVDWVEDSSDSEDSSSSPPIQTQKTPARQVKLLDYACGTGLVTRALSPYVTQSIGIDLSSGMVEQYNLAATNQGIPSSEMRAVVGNLISTSSSSPQQELAGDDFFNFDIAVVGLGFHHFDDPALAAKRLAERLRSGGILMIIDFLPHKGIGGHGHGHGHGHSHGNGHSHGAGAQENANSHSHSHSHSHNHGDHPKRNEPQPENADTSSSTAKVAETITHNGFSEADVKKMFEDAGVGAEFEYVTVGKGVVFSKIMENGEDMTRSIFMARGKKA